MVNLVALLESAQDGTRVFDRRFADGDGLALTRELKKRDPAVEVIVVTAYGSVRKAMEATKGAGAFYVLEKPFDPDEVLGLVKNALEHRKLLVENSYDGYHGVITHARYFKWLASTGAVPHGRDPAR